MKMSDLKPLQTSFKKINKKKLIGVKFFLFWFVLILMLFLAYWWNGSSNSSVFKFVFGKETTLVTNMGKVNVLLLGIAGGRHEGATLTDTVIIASYDLKVHKVSLISLPRDIWFDEHKAKINTLYQMGLVKDMGLDFAQREIGKILGISIPYGIRIDFSGFIKAVDLMDGIDVNVARSFDDYHYPIEGKEDDLCGYQEKEMEIAEEEAKKINTAQGKQKVLLAPDNQIATASGDLQKNLVYSREQVFKFFSCRFEYISFKQGLEHMDGAAALKFVRSRNGTNDEGTDFARSKRQQLVLQAFKDKVLSLPTLSDPGKIIALVKTLGASIDSNIPQNQYLEIVRLGRKIEGVESFVIDSDGDDPLLITPSVWEYGAWVLIPPDNNFGKIRQYIKGILSGKIEASGSADKKQSNI